MNGWQRIAVVLTTLWVMFVASYGLYERNQIPISWLGTELNNPSEGWNIARGLHFIDISSYPSGNTNGLAERLVKAKTDEERRDAAVAMNAAYLPQFGTELKDFFWLCLLAPIAALWSISYAAVFVGKWVVRGFSSNDKSL